MSNYISSLLAKLYPTTTYSAMIMGLGGAGKTSILYRMAINEYVQTVPTMGFNVESVKYSSYEVMFWDVGGCDKIRPLIRHYTKDKDVILYVFSENMGYDIDIIHEDVREVFNEPDLKNVPILVIANKSDLRNIEMSKEEAFRYLDISNEMARSRHIEFINVSCISGDGVFDIMPKAIDLISRQPLPLSDNERKPVINEASASAQSSDNPSNSLKKKNYAEIYEEWLMRDDESDEDFISKLDAFELGSWDHRTHLRIAFILLSKYGRKDGMKLIFEKIKRFIEYQSKNVIRNTFHETMTHFWVHMTHYSIASMESKLKSSIIAENLSNNSPEVSPFKLFLLMNPHLCNSELCLKYYTKETMFRDPKARQEVVLPDLKPLPSVLLDDQENIVKEKTPSNNFFRMSVIISDGITDEEFYENLQAKSLPNYGHETKIRGIYVHLMKEGRKSSSLSEISNLFRPIEKEHFHCSITYFWIHMITIAIAKSRVINPSITLDKFPFKEFMKNPNFSVLLDPLHIHKYYSKRLLDSEKAKADFAMSDTKVLPNYIDLDL